MGAGGWGWGLGLGLTDRSIPRRQFFTAPCGCGLQHRGPWGGSQQRIGVGKVRHLEVRFPWAQAALRDKKFTTYKVKGTENKGGPWD